MIQTNVVAVPYKLDLFYGRTSAKAFYSIVQRGEPHIILDFTQAGMIYPNGIIPMISEVSRYRAQGITFELRMEPNSATERVMLRNGWAHYLTPDDYPEATHPEADTSGLRQFRSSDELNPLVNAVLDICLKSDVLPRGVLETLEWSLNEIAGNILDHSERESGLVQLVYHPSRKHIAFVVCDDGIGIPESMRKQFNTVHSDAKAVELAMQRGVTSKPGRNQGYGLPGALTIAQQTGGICAVISYGGWFSVTGATVKCHEYFPPFHGTLVELQFDADKPVDAATLIGSEPVNYFETAFETSDGLAMVVDLAQFASSFGNRPTAVKLRNVIMNLLNESPSKRLLVNMQTVRVVSSSFADELFGRLFSDLGPLSFMNRIELRGVNEFCRRVIDKAIMDRMQPHG